jgi:hypothetical protein
MPTRDYLLVESPIAIVPCMRGGCGAPSKVDGWTRVHWYGELLLGDRVCVKWMPDVRVGGPKLATVVSRRDCRRSEEDFWRSAILAAQQPLEGLGAAGRFRHKS